MSAAERASKASSAEQANELVVRANEQTEEQMAQYSTRRFLSLSAHCATPRLMKAVDGSVFYMTCCGDGDSVDDRLR